jgi:hypothetical protein
MEGIFSFFVVGAAISSNAYGTMAKGNVCFRSGLNAAVFCGRRRRTAS